MLENQVHGQGDCEGCPPIKSGRNSNTASRDLNSDLRDSLGSPIRLLRQGCPRQIELTYMHYKCPRVSSFSWFKFIFCVLQKREREKECGAESECKGTRLELTYEHLGPCIQRSDCKLENFQIWSVEACVWRCKTPHRTLRTMKWNSAASLTFPLSNVMYTAFNPEFAATAAATTS